MEPNPVTGSSTHYRQAIAASSWVGRKVMVFCAALEFLATPAGNARRKNQARAFAVGPFVIRHGRARHRKIRLVLGASRGLLLFAPGTRPSMSAPSWLQQLQAERNARHEDGWERFAPHRRQVMRHVLRYKSANRRLAIAGAGNCNDLDLQMLTEAFEQVHLLDLDADAVSRGRERQAVPSDAALQVHRCDAVGAAEVFEQWREDGPPATADAVAQLRAIRPPPPPCGPADVCVSLCLISQILEAATLCFSSGRPVPPDVLLACRDLHLQWLLRSTAEEGVALLITDFTSSDTFPALPSLDADQLAAGLSKRLAAGDFFTGLHPGRLAGRLRELAGPSARDVTVSAPWSWNLGPRTYAVCALTVELGQPSAYNAGC